MTVALSRAQEQYETTTPAQSVAWRTFLRSLAIELDTLSPAASGTILRGTGQQMARLLTVVAVDSLEALELEMNLVLAEIGWGRVQLTLLETERCVVMTHTGLPLVGSGGDPPGTWLAPVMEGLYQGWMAQQPGADNLLKARISGYENNKIVIRYGR